jgi:arylsulfatase A-like enzyme
LFSIFNHNNGNPVALNTTYFPGASPVAEYWWTSDVYGTGATSTNVWCANSGGGLGGKPKAETVSAGGAFQYHARYVRGTKPTNGHNYRNNGDGTITDLDTNLMWTQIPGPAATWDTALTYAENLSLGGFSDWRLPNIKELQTLTDYALTTATNTTNIKPGINRTAFAKTLTNCTTTIGTTTVTCDDTTGLVIGMPVVDAASIASAYISNTTVPTIASVGTGTFTMSTAATGSGSGLTFKALVKPTAYWSSTSLKGDTTKAWLLETGINNAPTPPRNSQGIISYEAKTSSYPVFAVRTAPAGSVSQGRATNITTNLFPAGQRVSAVGTITAADGTSWTVPAATQFATAAKAPDLYNEYNAVTPANIAAAQTAIANLTTKVIDADGEVITGYIFSDNYFELYVNGVLVGVDPVPYTSFNSCVVKFKAKRPVTYAVKLVDWEENLGLGTELNGADPYHAGDGGFIANFSDGTVTNSQWKAQTFNIAPLDNASQVIDLANGTRDSSAATTHALTETAYGLHYPVPSDWFAKTFSTAGWPNATTYTEAQVGINNIPAYTNFPAQFGSSGAQFIWSSNLVLDNEVIVTYTGPAASPSQIVVEQPAATALTDASSTVAYGSVNTGSTSTKTFTIRNTSSISALSITGVTIDGANAGNFSVTTAPASSIAASGSTTMVVQFGPTSAGAKTAALHIASSDSSVGAAFDINLTGTGTTTPPTITNVTTNPTVPGNTDTPYITATVAPGSGATISGVNLTYSTGAQTTGPAFREIFGNGSTTTGFAGSMNAWTSTSVRAAGDAKLRGGTGNRTPAIVLTNCVTNSSTTVTCTSTTGLIPGMLISGTNIAGTATISSVTNGTTFEMSTAATGSGSGLSLTASGVTLTGCTTTSTSNSVTCLSTNGLFVGMGIAGVVTNPPNPTIATITPTATFTLNNPVTTGASGVTLTATGCAMEFSNGTSNYADTMGTTTNVISATAPTAGNVEFYVRNADLFSNNGWTFQISPDGGTTWNTRLSENFAASSATNCTLGNTTTVTCSNTSGLTVGNAIQSIPVSIAACSTNGTTTVNTVNTTGLVVGMSITGPTAAGIPNNARISAITAGVSFTLSATATATASNQTLTANYLPGNATVASISPNVSFTLNAATFYSPSVSGVTLSSVNHGFALKHYDLVAGDMSANMKLRFQMSGYSGAVAPARPPAVDIDDITVTLTTGAAPVTVQMFDDGLRGDGTAGDGVYGVQLPAFTTGTTVSYSIAATDSGSQTTTLSSAGSYTTGQAPTITSSATLPNATPNVAYSTTLAATGGAGGNVWSIVSGALPSGITLSSAGVISGTTASQGTFNVTVKVTDSAGRTGTKAFTLTVTTTTAPNVVIILTDDQGWADVGYHTPSGQVPIQTPNMDRFGTDGIRLEKFYPTTVCSVTRGSLLTGRNSLRTSVGNQKGLNPVEHLMPQTFKAAGYQTFMCGKWHIGGWDNNIYTTTMNGATIEVQHEGFDYHPIARGWDFHKGQYGGAINYFTHTTSDPGKNTQVDWWQNNVQLLNDNVDLQGNGGYSTDLLADKAVELIQTRDTSKPMLLYLAFNAIHAGVSAPASYINKYTALGVPAPRRTIAAAVDCMDVAMGRVLTALDTAGIMNNTLVVFMSDNGGDTTTDSLNTPLRGTKSDSYDGGLHTPAGIRWPGHLATGVTSNQYIWVGDMFPTLCAAVGVTPQNTKPFDGVNLWPALQSITPANPDGAPRGVPLVTGDAGGPVALNLLTDPISSTTKMFKLIRTPGTTVVNELFNLTDDPYETTDLLLGGNAASYASIVTTLTSAITGITTENYPPNFGITGITQTVVAGGSITLYAPFTSYKTAPTVQWKKSGTNVSSSTPFYQVTNGAANVAGVYMATLPLTNVTASDAGSYTATATNTTGNNTTPAGTLTVVTAPVLNALPAYTAVTSRSITWPAVTGATDYTVQVATNSGFTSGVSSQTVATNTATFTGLTSGTLYYYRATSNYNATSTPYSNTVSSTQDTTNPIAAITTSAGSTLHTSLAITGTASDARSGLASVTVNGVTATITSGTWTVTVPVNPGSNTITATATDNAGNTASASITITRTVSTQNDGVPDSWKLANGINPNDNSAISGPLGDLDGDGRQNLLEYAFNTSPQTTESDPFQSSPVTKAGDGLQYLQVSYPRRIGALDLVYAVEISDDLLIWPAPGSSTEPVSIIPNADGITETVTVRVLPAISSAAKKFVRIKVTTL